MNEKQNRNQLKSKRISSFIGNKVLIRQKYFKV